MEGYGRTALSWRSIGLWTSKALLIVAFASAGITKLYGIPMQIESFERIGLGQWFRYLVGSLELLGAVLLLTPRRAAFGAILLICVMVGAIITHLAIIGGSAIPAVVLLFLSMVVAYAHRDQIRGAIG